MLPNNDQTSIKSKKKHLRVHTETPVQSNPNTSNTDMISPIYTNLSPTFGIPMPTKPANKQENNDIMIDLENLIPPPNPLPTVNLPVDDQEKTAVKLLNQNTNNINNLENADIIEKPIKNEEKHEIFEEEKIDKMLKISANIIPKKINFIDPLGNQVKEYIDKILKKKGLDELYKIEYNDELYFLYTRILKKDL